MQECSRLLGLVEVYPGSSILIKNPELTDAQIKLQRKLDVFDTWFLFQRLWILDDIVQTTNPQIDILPKDDNFDTKIATDDKAGRK